MASELRRWRLIDELDDWLRWPMMMLSGAWLAILLVELTRGGSRPLEIAGTAIWVVFIAEFLVRYALAPAKLLFLKRNWLTLFVLIVPALRLFRIFTVLRAARGLRALRLVRIVGTANRSMRTLRATLRRRAFHYVFGLTALVTLLGAAGMRSFEPEAAFSSFGEALWWTAMLLTTIGSEYWPVTGEGRFLALLLALYSLAMLGYITATLASFFVGRDAAEPSGPVAGSNEMRALRRELKELRLALKDRAAI